MKKFLYYFSWIIFGFGIGILFALFFVPYPSDILRDKVKGSVEEGVDIYNKKKFTILNKLERISSNIDDIYRLYTHQDDIIPVNKVYSKEF